MSTSILKIVRQFFLDSWKSVVKLKEWPPQSTNLTNSPIRYHTFFWFSEYSSRNLLLTDTKNKTHRGKTNTDLIHSESKIAQVWHYRCISLFFVEKNNNRLKSLKSNLVRIKKHWNNQLEKFTKQKWCLYDIKIAYIISVLCISKIT